MGGNTEGAPACENTLQWEDRGAVRIPSPTRKQVRVAPNKDGRTCSMQRKTNTGCLSKVHFSFELMCH